MRRPRKPQTTQRIEFSLESDGKTYRCDRTVTGTLHLTQVISVWGVGSKADPAIYGKNGHPISSMDSVARIIAGEIIRERH